MQPIILLCFACILFIGCNKNYEKYLQKAEVLLKEGKPKKAIRYLQKYIENDSSKPYKNPKVRLQLAQLYLEHDPKNNTSIKLLEEAGLIKKSATFSSTYDYFRGRLIFPISDRRGQVIGFGGRALNNQEPKYLNSPETSLFHKGRILYQGGKTREVAHKTDQLIVVEGYMDVVSVYASGIKNVIANSGTAFTESQINLVWKFFSNPIICLDGDESGQRAAIRIAEKLFSLINESNRIYFTIMPDDKDPDDFIKENGKDSFLNLVKQKQIIQSFIWNYQLGKINQNNPYEISKFEKDIKKLAFSIQDEILKKYVLEDFLEKLKKLTPNQTLNKNYKYFPFSKKKDYKILKETKILHQKNENLSKIQIIEFSILYIILNFSKVASEKLEELSNIEFLNEKNENLKNIIINSITEDNNTDSNNLIVKEEYAQIINDINTNSNIQIITKNKSHQDILELLNELIRDHKDQNNLKKIESLEQKLINNLDESSYSELIKLKSQINRE